MTALGFDMSPLELEVGAILDIMGLLSNRYRGQLMFVVVKEQARQCRNRSCDVVGGGDVNK
jgi:hypothetical protein